MFVLLFQVFASIVLTLVAGAVVGYFLFLSDPSPAADLNANHFPTTPEKGEAASLGSGSSQSDLKDGRTKNCRAYSSVGPSAVGGDEAPTSEILLRGGGRALVTLVDGLCQTEESAEWVNDVLRWIATVGIMCATQPDNRKKSERIPTRRSSSAGSVLPIGILGVGDKAVHHGRRTIKPHVYISALLLKVTNKVREKINSRTFTLELKNLRHGSELVNIGVLQETEAGVFKERRLKQEGKSSSLSPRNELLSLLPLPRLTGSIVANFTCIPHGKMRESPHKLSAEIHKNDDGSPLNKGMNKDSLKAQNQPHSHHPLEISRLLSPSNGVYVSIPIVFSDPDLDMKVSGTFPLMINKFVNTQLLLLPDMLSIAGEVMMSNLTFACEVNVRITLRSVVEVNNFQEKKSKTKDGKKQQTLAAAQRDTLQTSNSVVRKYTVLDITFPYLPVITCHLETSLEGSDGRQGKIPPLREPKNHSIYTTSGKLKEEPVRHSMISGNAPTTPQLVPESHPSSTLSHSRAAPEDRSSGVVNGSSADTYTDSHTQNPTPPMGGSTRNHNAKSSSSIPGGKVSSSIDNLTRDDEGVGETQSNDVSSVCSPHAPKDDKLTEIVRLQLQRATKALVFPKALQIVIGGDEHHQYVANGVSEVDKLSMSLDTEALKGLSEDISDTVGIKSEEVKKAIKMQFPSVKVAVVTLQEPW